jgi:HEAT repeat protein
MNTTESVGVLLHLSLDTNREVRASAVTALAEFPDRKLIPSLLKLMQDESIAINVAYALSSNGTNAFPYFLTALGNSNRNVRIGALSGLTFRKAFPHMAQDLQP